MYFCLSRALSVWICSKRKSLMWNEPGPRPGPKYSPRTKYGPGPKSNNSSRAFWAQRLSSTKKLCWYEELGLIKASDVKVALSELNYTSSFFGLRNMSSFHLTSFLIVSIRSGEDVSDCIQYVVVAFYCPITPKRCTIAFLVLVLVFYCCP